MLADMKEQMKEQQAQSDRDQEFATLDHENAIREQEPLRQLNNQLQAQFTALQNPLTPTQSESKLEIGESLDIRILDELFQRRIKEAKWQFAS